MLENLEIKNGEMTPRFDPYNNIYSVKIADDTTKLEIEYLKKDNIEVNIIGNDLLNEEDSEVLIEVKNEDEVTTYTLYVSKEKSATSSFSLTDSFTPIEVKKELPGYVAPLISIICFLIILSTFVLLFSKKKKSK